MAQVGPIRSRQSGLTLVEMLVALLIMTAVISVANQSYRQFVVGAADFKIKYEKHLKRFQKQQLVLERLEGAMLYMSKQQSLFSSNETLPYWIGLSDSLTAVTYKSLQDPTYSAVFQLKLEGNDLLYCEKTIDTWLPQVDVVPDEICNFKVIVAENIKSLSLRYFSWSDYQDFLYSEQMRIDEDPRVVNFQPDWHSLLIGGKASIIPTWYEVKFVDELDSETIWMIPVTHAHENRRLGSWGES
ncbi:prepilin-type N-terminal cleavage/methylation domain-containing protein [Vibrio parahaemolyticus]|uniref:PulJ/GspJ family protein n=1 Tax=Vibrio parahaemolyticus TaxID=670 RepID=UPI00040069E6|nr:prepilin-type N-terminal cleavage/methylation domain-containing protein [Vibrio parahaemolyticus]ELA6984460.1 prepilin-type N-terminal cleavage/methylation domain-containing protein [Vibrio parahaemolyticus]MBE4370725.1 prepilin-type N-terminal cleavage/methylation domain-containing protein [Vibrio parahaemolyticus]MBE4430299.1 prepilin-type N-terminal cleavage/methylation domain-containing protein [Vibrio parahaemolyticus]MBM4848693.1 prepilin-type N-terminal cleavage/methylation domain-con